MGNTELVRVILRMSMLKYTVEKQCQILMELGLEPEATPWLNRVRRFYGNAW